MTNIKKWLGFVVWGLLALPMVSLVLTSYLLTPIIALPLPALMTRMRPAAAVGTINAVARSMWFQSLYAEADF